MENLLDWNMLTRVPYQDEVQSPLWIGLLIFFAAGFLISAGLYLRPPAAIKNHEVKRHAVMKHSNWFMWAFGVALVFFAFQVMGLQFIGIRLWTWITLAAILAVAILTIVYLVRQYPGEMAAYEARQAKRAYLRQTRQRPADDDGRPQPRSSRAEKRRQRPGSTPARGR
jgi:hypothetical protein